MNTSKVNRVEVIDLTKTIENGGGRVYTYWHTYRTEDKEDVLVTLDLQDEGRTLKVFINNKDKEI